MTAKTTRLKCVLLDANIIIETYELDLWSSLTAQIEIIVPSSVVVETKYFKTQEGGIPQAIDLRTLVGQGTIREVAASAEELGTIYQIFDRVFVEGLDPGEAEGLALLHAGKAPGAHFCTGDVPAIKALAMIGLSHLGVSLETVLGSLGLNKKLMVQYTEAFFEEHIKRGQKNRITGQGLTPEYYATVFP